MWTTGKEIKEAVENREAHRIIEYYTRFRRYGLPVATKGWGEYPKRLIDMLDALDDLHTVYFPRQTLI